MLTSPIVETEWRVLQWLCQATGRESAAARLEQYQWREFLHQVIFGILVSRPASSSESLKTLLPAWLTRRGFPDVAFEELFQPHGISESEVEKLIHDLLNSTR